MFGPDVSSSITLTELDQLVKGIRYLEKSLNYKVDKDSIAQELKFMRDTFRKSIVYSKNIKKGEIINKRNISFKKPGIGIEPSKMQTVLGKKLKKNVKIDDLLSLDDLCDKIIK